MNTVRGARVDPCHGVFAIEASILAALVILGAALLAPPVRGAEALEDAPVADTTGSGLLQWAYDTWSAPWVHVRGPSPTLAPASHATLMALSCETADLERDRLARHLSPEECEHRMAAIRADQDTALIFRLDLRVFDFRGSEALARLDPRVAISLEDDRGRRWSPIEVKRGPAVLVATGQKLRRIYYHPPWLRGRQHLFPDQYAVEDGRNLTVAEHRVRFARRDPRTGEPLVSSRTRWLRLRLAYDRHEWAATWPLRTDERP